MSRRKYADSYRYGLDPADTPRPVRGVPGGWRDWWNRDTDDEIDEVRRELVRQERLILAMAQSESAGSS